MVSPVIVEYGSFANGTVFVGELENLDAHFLMERQTHWKVFLPTNPAKHCFF